MGGGDSVSDEVPKENVTTEVAKETVQSLPVTDREACELVGRLLTEARLQEIELGDHSMFAPVGRAEEWDFSADSKFIRNRARRETTIAGLKGLEHELMQQIERLDLLERVFDKPVASTNDQRATLISELESAYHGLFVASMSTIRKKSKLVEVAVASLDAFLAEAGRSKTEAKYIRVLNAPADVFEDEAFAREFGRTYNFEKQFEDTCALWVSSAEFDNKTYGVFAENAEAHHALALANANLWGLGIDESLRLDWQVMDGKTSSTIEKMAEDAPKVFNRLLKSDTKESKHVAICACPVRVRFADHAFGETEDVTVPLSFVLGGVLFRVSATDPNKSPATNVTRLTDEFEIRRSYMDPEVRQLETPQLISFDRALKALNEQHVIAIKLSERGIGKSDEGAFRITLSGHRTVNHETENSNSISAVLVECMLDRYLLQIAKEAEGIPVDRIDDFARNVYDRLKSLQSEESQDERPLAQDGLKVEVIEHEGKPALRVTAQHRVGIRQLKIVTKFRA